MTPDDAAEERVEDDVEEDEEAAFFRLDELDETRSAVSVEADALRRVDLRDGAGMLLQVRKRQDNVMVDEDEGVARGICEGVEVKIERYAAWSSL